MDGVFRAIAFATIVARAAPATTFFVSSSKGDDAGSGTSPSAPWRTLPRAALGASRPGDSILLRAGDEFDLDATLVLQSFGSGAADGSLPAAMLSSYDDGQGAGTPRPLLRRGVGTAAGAVVQCVECSGVAVAGLEVSGGEQGLLFTYMAPAVQGGVSVTDCFVHDVRGTRTGANPLNWASCIGFNASARTDVAAVNINITGNLFNSSDVIYQNCVTAQTHGGCVWPDGGSGGYVTIDGLRFAGNVANRISYNSAFFAFTRHSSIDSNTFIDDIPDVLFPLGTTDIIVGAVDGTLSITNNEIRNRGEVKGGPDGCGIDLEDSSSGIVLANNYISNTVGAGIMLFAGTGSGSKNITLFNNTLLLDGCEQPSGDHGVIAFLHAGQTGLVSNNTLAACPGKEVYNGDTSGFSFSGNKILNGSVIASLVVAAPIVTAAPAGAGAVHLDAACATPGAVLRYTLDGSRVTTGSPAWPAGGVDVGLRATAVLVKGFAAGMVESAVAGGVFAGARA
jgi:hypothetical protein